MSERLLQSLRTVPDFPEPGILYRDISPILASPALLAEALDQLMAPWAELRVDMVVGIESRGFLFGAMLAERLGAGFTMARKPGKLPAETISQEYALEYGVDRIELHSDAFRRGDRVLVHDDVIATGGTAVASGQLVERLGANLVGFSFLIELASLGGRRHLPAGVPVQTVITI